MLDTPAEPVASPPPADEAAPAAPPPADEAAPAPPQPPEIAAAPPAPFPPPPTPPDPCGPALDLEGDAEFLNFLAATEGLLPANFYAFNRESIDFPAAFRTG